MITNNSTNNNSSPNNKKSQAASAGKLPIIKPTLLVDAKLEELAKTHSGTSITDYVEGWENALKEEDGPDKVGKISAAYLFLTEKAAYDTHTFIKNLASMPDAHQHALNQHADEYFEETIQSAIKAIGRSSNGGHRVVQAIIRAVALNPNLRPALAVACYSVTKFGTILNKLLADVAVQMKALVDTFYQLLTEEEKAILAPKNNRNAINDGFDYRLNILAVCCVRADPVTHIWTLYTDDGNIMSKSPEVATSEAEYLRRTLVYDYIRFGGFTDRYKKQCKAFMKAASFSWEGRFKNWDDKTRAILPQVIEKQTVIMQHSMESCKKESKDLDTLWMELGFMAPKDKDDE